MIFIIVGSQKFQFNRLLKEIDFLLEKRIISEEVFAQIGYSDYLPHNYAYKDFLDKEEFKRRLEISEIVITHGGTGAVVGAIKQGKKLIVVPRLKKFGEHVDDHQLQIIEAFKNYYSFKAVMEISELGDFINNIEDSFKNEYVSGTSKIIAAIDKFILYE